MVTESWEFKRKMSLRIVVNYGRDSLMQPDQDRPMAGVQTAALALCSALSRRGHDVHLFARCANPGRHGGVTFHDRSEFAGYAAANDADVLVAIPELLSLLMPLRARARVIWTGNAYLRGDCMLSEPSTWAQHNGGAGKSTRLYSVSLLNECFDHLIVGSQWHAQQVRASLDGLDGKVSVAYLGVPLEYYRPSAPGRHPFRVVYTSQARRGLRHLLHLFPLVRAAVPEAELHLFTNKDVATRQFPDLKGASQPGVYWRRRVSKSELARELRSAALMAYPSRFSETFCLAVAEAQAAGLPVVTSARAALTERISHGVDGYLIHGKPDDEDYQTAFVEAVIRLLRDERLRTEMGNQAGAKARRLYDWHSIASSWEALLERLVAGKESAPPPADPTLDLLDTSLLTDLRSRSRPGVPPELAKRWLQKAWASYGYDPIDLPGVPSDR